MENNPLVMASSALLFAHHGGNIPLIGALFCNGFLTLGEISLRSLRRVCWKLIKIFFFFSRLNIATHRQSIMKKHWKLNCSHIQLYFNYNILSYFFSWIFLLNDLSFSWILAANDIIPNKLPCALLPKPCDGADSRHPSEQFRYLVQP